MGKEWQRHSVENLECEGYIYLFVEVRCIDCHVLLAMLSPYGPHLNGGGISPTLDSIAEKYVMSNKSRTIKMENKAVKLQKSRASISAVIKKTNGILENSVKKSGLTGNRTRDLPHICC